MSLYWKWLGKVITSHELCGIKNCDCTRQSNPTLRLYMAFVCSLCIESQFVHCNDPHHGEQTGSFPPSVHNPQHLSYCLHNYNQDSHLSTVHNTHHESITSRGHNFNLSTVPFMVPVIFCSTWWCNSWFKLFMCVWQLFKFMCAGSTKEDAKWSHLALP